MNSFEITPIDLYVCAGAVVLWLLSGMVAARISKHAGDVIRLISNLLVPTVLIFWITDQVLELDRSSDVMKLEQTVVGLLGLWIVARALKAVYLRNASDDSFRGRTPQLLIGIFSFGFVAVGGLFVFAGIWKKDLSPLLTTFGVGSLVFGLALQDTLGNLFAGLALVFDRPFEVGDWIQVGDVIGRVKQIDWRSVKVVTRELNETTIPNVTLGKERILNFSSPNPLYGLRVTIGFSYDAPPNVVRDMLTEVALGTPGVVSDPYPDIRTLAYNAYTVDYESFFFISDYGPVNRIRSEFMTRVWYAAQRHGVAIPYPISTVYRTEIPPQPSDPKQELRVLELIRGADLFKSLNEGELNQITQDCRLEAFPRSQYLFREGDEGNHLYVFLDGEVAVQLRGDEGIDVTLAVLRRGDVLGEMALFTGEPRKAAAVALTDVRVARIDKSSIAELLESREELISAFVASIGARVRAADDLRQQLKEQLAQVQPQAPKLDDSALRQRIMRFFGLK